MAEIVPPGSTSTPTPTSVPVATTPKPGSDLSASAADRDTPSLPIGIAIVILAIVVVLYFGKAKPVATGSVSNVFAMEQPSGDRTWVGMELRLHNNTDKELEVQKGEIKLITERDTYTDQPAPRSDVARYVQAIPELKKSDAPVLASGTKIPVGGDFTGTMLVAFPVKKAEFESRKEMQIELQFYQGTIVFKK
jgi:hypothetical protein